jgi:signal transduction histidine kinase
VFNIIPADVNRPLAHLTHKLNYGQLVDDAESVLRQLGGIVHELQTSSGESYLVRLLPYRTVDHKIDGVVITLVDITERVRNASERQTLSRDLAEQQMQFEAVVQQMPVGLVIAEAPSGRIIYSNAGSPGQWGTLSTPFATVLSETGPTYQAFHQDGSLLTAEEWPMTRAITRGEVVLNEEIRLVLENEEEAIMLISATPLRDSGGLITAGVLTWADVTQRKEMEKALREAHDQLEDRVAIRTAELAQVNEALQVEAIERQTADQARRELLRQLVSAQEEEQRHISRELHDQLGQSLTGLRFILDTMARRSSAAQRDQLDEATAIVDDMTDRISNLALDLRPPVLDDLGLIPALITLIERFTARTGVAVDLQHSGLDGRLSPALETVVFRVVQEALTNVARHAGVTTATVQILGDHDVIVRIEDHGQGFDPDTVRAAADTAGLAGMRERVTLLGGELTIDSAPGEGTRVIAQLPKEQPAAHE